jgi:hypothetical protein
MKCDNCGKKTNTTETIKWPGLDTCIQYEEVCFRCWFNFVAWKKSRGKNKNIFKIKGDV